MKLNAPAMALAAAVVAAAFFAVCVFFVAVAQVETARFIGYVFHLDLTGISRSPTWLSFLVGVVSLAIYVGLFGGILAAVYNRLVKS
jgi:hypothetical protein